MVRLHSSKVSLSISNSQKSQTSLAALRRLGAPDWLLSFYHQLLRRRSLPRPSLGIWTWKKGPNIIFALIILSSRVISAITIRLESLSLDLRVLRIWLWEKNLSLRFETLLKRVFGLLVFIALFENVLKLLLVFLQLKSWKFVLQNPLRRFFFDSEDVQVIRKLRKTLH